MRLLQNLHFRFYQLMVDVGNADIGNFASTLFMTFIFGVNLLTLLEIMELSGIGVKYISKATAIAVIAGIFVLLHFLLVYNGRSAPARERHAGETKGRKLRGRLGLFAYIILSIGLLVGTWILLAQRNNQG